MLKRLIAPGVPAEAVAASEELNPRGWADQLDEIEERLFVSSLEPLVEDVVHRRGADVEELQVEGVRLAELPDVSR